MVVCLLSWRKHLRFVPTVCIVRPTHHSPIDVLRTSLMLSRPPPCASFFTACSYHGSSRRLTPATGRVRLTLPENANSCNCVIYLCDRFGISKDRMWNIDETAVRIDSSRRARVDQEGRVSPRFLLARLRHGHACCKHERRHVYTYCL